MRKRDLIRLCTTLESHVLARKLATKAEVDAERPGRGKKDTLERWIHFHSNLVSFCRREEWVASRREEAEERMLAGLTNEPITVTLLDGAQVKVYPKSFHTLMWFRARDWALEWITVRLELLKDAANAGRLKPGDVAVAPPQVVERAAEEQSRILLVLASEACREGVGLSPQAGEIDDQLRDLDPIDIARIHHAFVEVNGARLDAASALVKPSRPGSTQERMSWSVFFSTLKRQAKQPLQELTHDTSLVSILATTRLGKPDPDREVADA